MSGKIIYESPKTQASDAVKQLIAYFNHGQQPEEMPAFYRLSGDMVLVQSAKKDVYYVATPQSCSCPAATYHPDRLCKHSRKYFPLQQTRGAPQSPSIDLPGWPGGMNGPFDEMEAA